MLHVTPNSYFLLVDFDKFFQSVCGPYLAGTLLLYFNYNSQKTAHNFGKPDSINSYMSILTTFVRFINKYIY